MRKHIRTIRSICVHVFRWIREHCPRPIRFICRYREFRRRGFRPKPSYWQARNIK